MEKLALKGTNKLKVEKPIKKWNALKSI